MKTCSKCRQTKPTEDFPVDRSRKDGRRTWCRECARAATRKWQKGAGEHRRAYRRAYGLRSTYGLSEEAYQELLASQGGVCAVCHGSTPGGNGAYLHVDHDHSTGHVRGLLCSECNNGIGKLHDSPELCDKAAEYLRKSKCRPSLIPQIVPIGLRSSSLSTAVS